MTADIDRQKLRELCERATPGPWTVDETNADDVQSPTRFAGPVVVYADGDCDVHPVADCSCNHTCRDDEAQRDNASFIAAARTALPALLDITDAQAAKIAELKAGLRDARKERDAAICTAGTLKGIGAAFRELESERDQLRKQVEAAANALSKVLSWAQRKCPCDNEKPVICPLCGSSSEPGGGGCMAADNTLPESILTQMRAILSAASALEQKERE